MACNVREGPCHLNGQSGHGDHHPDMEQVMAP